MLHAELPIVRPCGGRIAGALSAPHLPAFLLCDGLQEQAVRRHLPMLHVAREKALRLVAHVCDVVHHHGASTGWLMGVHMCAVPPGSITRE